MFYQSHQCIATFSEDPKLRFNNPCCLYGSLKCQFIMQIPTRYINFDEKNVYPSHAPFILLQALKRFLWSVKNSRLIQKEFASSNLRQIYIHTSCNFPFITSYVVRVIDWILRNTFHVRHIQRII